MNEHDFERLNDLLADRAVQGLNAEELAELKELMRRHPEWAEWDNRQLDIAAAAASLSDVEIDEPLPDALRERIRADASSYFEAAFPTAAASGEENGTSRRQQVLAFPTRARLWQMAGWYAAAACLLLAALGWYPRVFGTTPVPQPSLAELRDRLMREAPDVIQSSWSPATYEPGKGVRGDVVWSNNQQQGFMRFQGIPAVDPSVGEYQLWIFDADRDERYPVDGGVFDVNEERGEVIVRIDAKIRVSEPRLFAITVERPGGVVVSQRDRLMLVAKVE